MKIGIVDLDTSHPNSWIPIERELGHDIVGVYDGGSVHPRSYVDDFVKEHDLGRVYESLDDLAGDCDAAIIHACDWDTHVDKARPFVDAGKALLVDKPLAGNLRDLNQLVAWAAGGARITGGSSLRFCAEATEWLAQPQDERGVPHTVFAGCGVDEFNYGIHAYALLQSITGSGVESVRQVYQGKQRLIHLNYRNGAIGVLSLGTVEKWLPFHASIVTDRAAHQFITDNTRIYRSLLTVALPYLAGETDDPPVAMGELIEVEKCALAARQSWLNGSAVVKLADLSDDDAGYDGAAFAAEYKAAKYPQ